MFLSRFYYFFFFKAEDGIRDDLVTGVQTCAFPISLAKHTAAPDFFAHSGWLTGTPMRRMGLSTEENHGQRATDGIDYRRNGWARPCRRIAIGGKRLSRICGGTLNGKARRTGSVCCHQETSVGNFGARCLRRQFCLSRRQTHPAKSR